METYTDFGVSYLIQTFVNKINTKLYEMIVELSSSSSPSPNLKFSERAFYILWNKRKSIAWIEAVVFTHMTLLPLSLNKWFCNPHYLRPLHATAYMKKKISQQVFSCRQDFKTSPGLWLKDVAIHLSLRKNFWNYGKLSKVFSYCYTLFENNLYRLENLKS